MKKILKTVLVQTDTIWENIDKNLQNLTLKINSISEEVDVIILPELFSTGFTMNAKPVAESMSGKAIKWMLEKASDKNSLIIGSLIISENENIYNRLIAAFPPDNHRDGEIKYYDKRHLFSYANEDKVFTDGNKRLTIEYKGWKIMPLICYDLRFPEALRTLALRGAEIVALPTNWPDGSQNAPQFVTRTRALENRIFLLACNRVGHESGFWFFGRSQITAPDGSVLAEAGSQEELCYAEIEPAEARRKRLVLRPGEFELDTVGDRRPELYGELVKEGRQEAVDSKQ